MQVDFRPMTGSILVRVIQPPALTRAGIEIPLKDRQSTRRAEVLAVGLQLDKTHQLVVGDIVCLPDYYDQGGGNIIYGEMLGLPSFELDDDNKQHRVKYAILKELEIMGTFTGDREALLSSAGPDVEELPRDIETNNIMVAP